jgi:transcriptional regulator with XRE-family HTH domain
MKNKNHGKAIEEIAKSKGLNQTELGKLLNKTSQAVRYDISRESLKQDTLYKYCEILEIPLSDLTEIQKELETNFFRDKYYHALEEISLLKNVIIKHGIKVESELLKYNRGFAAVLA